MTTVFYPRKLTIADLIYTIDRSPVKKDRGFGCGKGSKPKISAEKILQLRDECQNFKIKDIRVVALREGMNPNYLYRLVHQGVRNIIDPKDFTGEHYVHTRECKKRKT